MKAIGNIWKSDNGFIWMLAISILILASAQLTEGLVWESKFILRTGFFLITIVAVKSSSLSSAKKTIGYFIAGTILLLAIAMIRMETPALNLVYTMLITGYMIYIIILVVSQIFANRVVTNYKIAGGVAVYVLLGHVCASLYLALYIMQSDSFQFGGERIQAVDAVKQLSYFSFVTLTTVGYGDVTAVAPFARVLAMVEALLGQLFPAIFIAKLVSQQVDDSRKK